MKKSITFQLHYLLQNKYGKSEIFKITKNGSCNTITSGNEKIDLRQFLKDDSKPDFRIFPKNSKQRIVVEEMKIRHHFRQQYANILPKYDLAKDNLSTLNLLFYKEFGSEKLKYTTGNIPDFCKSQKSIIEKALHIQSKKGSWLLFGPDCKCIRFKYLEPHELDGVNLEKIYYDEKLSIRI